MQGTKTQLRSAMGYRMPINLSVTVAINYVPITSPIMDETQNK